MNKIEQALNVILPPNQTLWERGGATMEEREIEPGHREMVPFFDLEIDDIKQTGEKILTNRRDEKIGRTVAYTAFTSDGIDREVHVHLPDTPLSDFVVTDGAAWTTRNEGYARDRAERIVNRAGVPVIQVGAEHSSERGLSLRTISRLGKTVKNSLTVSLAKTAQSEELIINTLMDEHGLPRSQYAIGDSRAAMKVPSQYPYAKEYGSEIIYMDTTAPCVLDKLDIGDLPRFAKWGAVELVGGVAISSLLILEGQVDDLKKTSSINPHFVASSIIGIMPALAAGSDASHLVPKDAHGHIVVYDRDEMSESHKWGGRYENHDNIEVHRVENGIHLSLVSSYARAKQVRRVSRFSELFNLHGGDVSQIDHEETSYINNDRYPRLHVA